MTDPAPERIAVTFSMTADDYDRCFKIMNRKRRRDFFLICCWVGFGAIPAAFAFRWLEMRLSGQTAVAEIVGVFSLLAYLLGIVTVLGAGLVAQNNASRQSVAATLNAFESKNATFDADGMTLSGQISQATWRWPAVTGIMRESGLFLIWIGATPVVIPDHSFGSDAARATALAFIRARMAEVKGAGAAAAAINTPSS